MIRAFRHKGLGRFFELGSKAGIQAAHAERLRLILGLLNVAKRPEDLGLPGLDLHRLKGARECAWSVKASGNLGIAMRMHNPPHPGEIIKSLCLEPLGLTVTAAAKGLGISRKTLSAILNGRAGVSPEMAVRLSIAFNTSAETWLNSQLQHDLWHAEARRKKLRVMRLAA